MIGRRGYIFLLYDPEEFIEVFLSGTLLDHWENKSVEDKDAFL
jgi:hypothetical protein